MQATLKRKKDRYDPIPLIFGSGFSTRHYEVRTVSRKLGIVESVGIDAPMRDYGLFPLQKMLTPGRFCRGRVLPSLQILALAKAGCSLHGQIPLC